MPRYSILTGIGKPTGGSNDPSYAKQFPALVIVGPSGNFWQVAPPSGGGLSATLPVSNKSLHQSELTASHKSVSWWRNEAILSLRDSYNTINDDWFVAWHPYFQTGIQFTNPSNFNVGSMSINSNVIFDGRRWKSLRRAIPNDSNLYYKTPLTLANGVFWINPIGGANQDWKSGMYEGKAPQQQVSASITGFVPQGGDYGADEGRDPNYQLAGDGTNDSLYAGQSFPLNSIVGYNAVDMIEWNGTVYSVGQYYMVAHDPRGSRGTMIWYDGTHNEALSSQTEADGFSNRHVSNFGGGLSRSLSILKNQLYMLSNDGRIHLIRPGGARQISDIGSIDTPWSSGVFGGSIGNSSPTAWLGSKSAYRCKLLTFNNQLHAFLNFQSSYKLAKNNDVTINTNGKAIAWFTSHDGVNWSDRSTMLPSSGIISPSGGSLQELTAWNTQNAPYRFSGFTGDTNFGPSGNMPSIYGSGIGSLVSISGIQPAQPSGFRQTGSIPFALDPSGDMIVTPGTAYQNLPGTLEFGALSGTLFPTYVNYPGGFGGDNGILAASGQGPTGYDYTGCHNYHIAGYVDDEDNVARLIFTEDFQGAASPLGKGSTLYFELNSSSGWIQKNYVTETNQLNGLSPCGMFDPEIVIPSGSLLEPNPSIDHNNGTLSLKYNLYDYIYWDKVAVTGEYSTDGIGWHSISREQGKDTSSKQVDPSGIIGIEHIFSWNYAQIFGRNELLPNVRIRLKATKDFPNV